MEINYCTTQLITYIGNKRRLLPYIESEIQAIQKLLASDKTINADLFAGSGCVSRLMKQYSSLLIANDFENFSHIVTDAYLVNKSVFDSNRYREEFRRVNAPLDAQALIPGIISDLYAPKDTEHVKAGERAFYTRENALRIDTVRFYIDTVEDPYIRRMMLAQLLTEASVHTNTSGVFKGFYKDKSGIGCFGGAGKNALQRITGPVRLCTPVLSDSECQTICMRQDAKNVFSDGLSADITYIDPPYNQHPYGSNYFMLNVIAENKRPNNISRVSGIPEGWKRSAYNSANSAKFEIEQLIKSINSKFIIFSYSGDGFISIQTIKSLIEKNYGEVIKVQTIPYISFRGGRNAKSRKSATEEYLITAKSS